jgi:hypothetical protein
MTANGRKLSFHLFDSLIVENTLRGRFYLRGPWSVMMTQLSLWNVPRQIASVSRR